MCIRDSIGATPMGGSNPIRIQSMTNTATQDTEASVAQAKRIVDAGDMELLKAHGAAGFTDDGIPLKDAALVKKAMEEAVQMCIRDRHEACFQNHCYGHYQHSHAECGYCNRNFPDAGFYRLRNFPRL